MLRSRMASVIALLIMGGVLPVFAAEFFVDAKNGNDDWDGTAETAASDVETSKVGPKRSLSAVAALVNLSTDMLTTVTVLPGCYGEDEGTDTTMEFTGTNGGKRLARVVLTNVTSKRNVVFRSKYGKDVTQIVGKSDSNSLSGRYGCGPNAVGGTLGSSSSAATYSAFCGFTFRDCRSCDSTTDNVDRGGAASLVTLVDCVVSNNAATRGGGGQAIHAFRCRFTANRVVGTSYGAAVNSAQLSNCLIDHNIGGAALSYSTAVVNCTIVDNDCSTGTFYSESGSSAVYNTLVVGNAHNGAPNLKDTLFKACVTQAKASAYPKDADCKFEVDANQFKNPTEFDYRLISSSDAVGAGKSEYLSALPLLDFIGDSVDRDYSGAVIDLTKAQIQAGCLQEIVMLPPKVVVDVDPADVEVEGGVIGENEIGDSAIIVRAKRADTRPFLGFMIDGEIVTRGTSMDLRSLGLEPGMTKTLTAAYGNVWYVKQIGGDDGNTGAYEELAKKTITAASDKAVAGDVIKVYRGVYGEEEGARLHSPKIDSGTDTLYLKSRVVIADGVIVEAVEGSECTSIVGAPDPNPVDVYGSGPDAVRCVVLGSGAVIRGFTITGGRADHKGESYDDNRGAAGVLARGSRTSLVEDCVVSSNAAPRGAAGMNCRFARSRIIGNIGIERVPSGRACSYYGCIIDGGRGGGLEHVYDFDSCTFGSDNLTLDESNTGSAFVYPHLANPIKNSLFLVNKINIGSGNGIGLVASNCVFIAGGGSTDPRTVVPEEFRDTCVFLSKLQDIVLDEDYRPIPGVTTNVILDAITPEFEAISNNDLLGDRDITGVQRRQNGRRDIGALEGDWKGRYSRDVGRLSAVTEASPDVVEDAGKVKVPSGSTLVLSFDNDTEDAMDCELRVQVVGGSLALNLDETELAPVTAAAEAVRVKVPVPTGHHTLKLMMTGEGGYARVLRFSRVSGAVIMVR